MKVEDLSFDADGLIPAVVQDRQSKEVLTVAYMNRESLQKTIETKETWFYSRSRQELWHKGATSGNTQVVEEIRYDCDQDALVVLARPNGPACHKGDYSCFSNVLFESEVPAAEQDRFAIIHELEETIAKRSVEMPEGAYTTYLFTEGVDKILKKVGEEASEVIIAAKNRDASELSLEAADLLYHMLVLLREQGVALDDIVQVLENRHGQK
ncbi:phosphoribosyl-ATP pyrophosphatase /phosphoribosyl-AMP cyclohydrolase [Salsuginibacillus halophilus]|uniref:Histidine biosynthesis bifunctional protein HisIE n=1 Tax=Salsuginibacillus halophilus TaxID=517424 RepID=A0A2P8H956_9BACI|nr:bifunctional phosphoribosyl-AMP cyclohydrolase/phosphoribosyl-ATP diphosphatase HisIE [Salsuginibacillus halophilus]PSL42766.1 phosphoribosyl-ATP pyrophosphatase /phosphoribosyl-AMP cyclohydrolase [Salsuginibacillus halophilus]